MSRSKSRARRRRRRREHAEANVAGFAIRLRDLVEEARREARRTSAPRPGRAAVELLELMGEIEQSDSLLWPVLRRAGLLAEEYAEERAMAAQAVAARLTWTTPRTVHRRRELEQSGY
jgi:hypothetical protein